MSSKLRLSVALAVIVGLLAATVSAAAYHADEQEYHPIDNEEFENVWERTDRPVAEIVEARTWIWGPGGFSFGMDERYEEAPEGERRVQYFDKSRMEMTWNDGADANDVDSPWNITQGLLASELMTGRMQLGDDTFRQFHPSQRSAAGDPEDTTAPTYAALGNLMDREAREGENVIIEHADRAGVITAQEERFAHHGVGDVASDQWQDIEGIEHNIADVFWDFMNSDGIIWDGENYVDDQPIFLNAFYAVGYPLTDAFWADVRVDGEVQDVLIQAFERRVLTYTPGNPEGWEVESGNIGQHYFDWRYNQIGEPLPAATIQFDPVEATNTVRTEYTLTATLHDEGVAVDVDDVNDVNVTIDRDNGNNDIGETVEVVDGAVEVSYTGPDDPAVDTITVQIEYAGDTAEGSTTKTWVAADPELSLALNQDEDANLVGTDHEFTATLTENGTDVDIPDGSVSVEVVRDGGTEPVDLSDNLSINIVGNVATMSYTGPAEPAIDVIAVSVTVNDSEIVGAPTLTKTWAEAEPAGLTLEMWEHPTEPQSPINVLGGRHHVVAEVSDQFGESIADVSVTFSLSDDAANDPVSDLDEYGTFDPDAASPGDTIAQETVGTTNADGRIGFFYEGEITGEDTIVATVTDSTDAELADTRQKFWIEQPVAVDLQDGDVESHEATDTDDFVDPPFTYYVVRNLPEYQQALYYEPERLGDEVRVLGGDDSEAFWFGVSAPDEDTGLQSEIVHQGKVTLYLQRHDDSWVSLTAEFDAEGNLVSVNDISPQV